MNKKIAILACLALAVFFTALQSPLSACAMCGCRQRRRRAEQKAYAAFHEHEGHEHKSHAHGKDVRLDPSVAVVSTAGLVALRSARLPMTIVDARAGKYDDGLRIPGAISLHAKSPLKHIQRKLRSKRRLVVTYCAGLKCPASAELAALLGKLGYKNVIEYPYGISGWRNAGHPTARAQ